MSLCGRRQWELSESTLSLKAMREGAEAKLQRASKASPPQGRKGVGRMRTTEHRSESEGDSTCVPQGPATADQ
eukprot:325460-Alexandrium_andersonii.AAC.1